MDDVKYDVTIKNSPLSVTVTAAMQAEPTSGATSLVATVESVPDVDIEVEPTGNIMQKIYSTVAEPIAQLVASKSPGKARDVMEGMSVQLYTLGTYSADTVAVTPRNASLSSALIGETTMVKVTATLSAAYVASVPTPPSTS